MHPARHFRGHPGQAAATPAERRVALDELHYLLNDNVEVITAPPQPPV